MTDDRCEQMKWLIQADVDQELDASGAARVLTHLKECEACAQVHAQLVRLSTQVRRDVPAFDVPAGLQRRLAAMSGAQPVSEAASPRAEPLGRKRFSWGLSGRWLSFGGGAATAALAVFLVMGVLMPGTADGLPDAVVASHVRGLQPGHLIDIASTDQHTVKPWFDGRIDYAPVVKDLAPDGFPLIGGRLDYLANRPVATLVYQRRGHSIDLFAWPDRAGREGGANPGVRSGYNYVHWRDGEMTYWAVSDVSASELDVFASQWRGR